MFVADDVSWERVESVEDFRDYLLHLSEEAHREPCPWRNATVPAFLSGWASYLVAGKQSFEDGPGWRGLASMLHEARDHEFVFPCHKHDDPIETEQRVTTASDLIFYPTALGFTIRTIDIVGAPRRGPGLWSRSLCRRKLLILRRQVRLAPRQGTLVSQHAWQCGENDVQPELELERFPRGKLRVGALKAFVAPVAQGSDAIAQDPDGYRDPSY